MIPVWCGAILLMALEGEPTWKPQPNPIMTRWAKDVDPQGPLPEYPRPQMVRPDWQNLNGLWDYAITPGDAAQIGKPEGKILVPFCVESALSGVKRRVSPQQKLWYQRKVTIGDAWRGGRVLLHFGAVDWRCVVSVNGQTVGEHEGGYDPFSFDITNALVAGAEQVVTVAVTDPTTRGPQPRGKQVLDPGGIYYTPTTGIWQTVWLESVPRQYIKQLRLTPTSDLKGLAVAVELPDGSDTDATMDVTVLDGTRIVAQAAGNAAQPMTLTIPEPKLWQPESPFLYDVVVKVGQDKVQSYVGLRSVSLKKDAAGVNRLALNGKILFHFGPLDQGFWPDGLYTAPTEEALKFDIEMTLKFGFNMCRKHVKVEPARWYYWCDKLGLLVWQDMPSGERSVDPGKGEITRDARSAAIYRRELAAMVSALRHFPSIVLWVPFNEGWGQFETATIVGELRKLDQTRLIDCASGWNDVAGVGDVHDIHVYPGPAAPPIEANRAAVLGEYGGLGLPIPGHTWQSQENWGYRSYKTVDELTTAYASLTLKLRQLIGPKGLAAAVYTQTTDVETEVNGLMTYDREVVKIPVETLRQMHEKLEKPLTTTVVVPTMAESDESVAYTTTKPVDTWMSPAFDSSTWQRGRGGFGTPGTPGAKVNTRWDSPSIWVRREFTLNTLSTDGQLALAVHHDEDMDVYINGEKVASLAGYTTDYQLVPLPATAIAQLRIGANVLALTCRQTGGGQYIDVGLVQID